MSLTLYLAPGTIAMCVHAALEETGTAHDLHWVDFASGAQQESAYLAVNPKGRVPALAVDGAILTEAPALLEYIAATSGNLMPQDPFEAARTRETMSYLASTVHVAHAHGPRARRWADDAAAQQAMRAKVEANMTDCATYLNARLEGDYVGSEMSVADLHLWNVTRWMEKDGVALSAVPALAAHHDRIAARPAVARVIALHQGR